MNTASEKSSSNIEAKNSDLYLGRHLTLDYYDCDTEVLLDPDLLEKTLIESAKAIWATIITSDFHKFEPQGVSWVVEYFDLNRAK